MMELLAPCGNKDSFFAAVNNGANAVYLGLSDFSARKSAENFDENNIGYYIAYAHTLSVKVYVAVNTVIKDDEINKLLKTVKAAYLCGADAFIVQDVFLGKMLKDTFPQIELHLSTQAGINNVQGAKFAAKNGFKRVILARECNIEEIKKIAKVAETEVFVQGALCTCFSGHCYMSSFIGGNSGNRGYCKQPCRQKYSIESKVGKGEYSISLSDLCLINELKKLEEAGVSSVKIEGRMRSPEYVAASVMCYRNAIDGKEYDFSALMRTYNRGNYTSGYVYGQDKNLISDKTQSHIGERVGKIVKIKGNSLVLDTPHSFSEGDCFKILRNGFEVGNAIAVKGGKIEFNGEIRIGDELNVTKDISLSKRLLSVEKRKKTIEISGEFLVGKRASLRCEGITVYSEHILEEAKTSPLSEENVISNLNKVDVYPFSPKLTSIMIDKPFILKSELNSMRSELYEKVFYNNVKHLKINDINYDFKINYDLIDFDNVIIGNTFREKVSDKDLFVLSPDDYDNLDRELLSRLRREYKFVYLYVPSFLSEKDFELINGITHLFDGIYADGLGVLEFAKNNGLKILAGIGLNVFNQIDIYSLQNMGIGNIVLSQEASRKEYEKYEDCAYCFTNGAIRLMELMYCPFNRNCSTCKRGDFLKMKDSLNHEFVLRRFKLNGQCRFEIYNGSVLSLPKTKHNVYNLVGYEKQPYNGKTIGNFKRGIF